MWETRHSIADWVCSKTQTLLANLRTRNQPREVSCVFFGSRTFVPVSWMCKKQTAVSHSSTESEIVSLDAGLPALDLWDIVIEVLRSTNNNVQPKHTSIQESGATPHSKTKAQKVKRRQKVVQLSDVDFVLTDTHSSQNESQLHIFEDKEAVIKMIIKGRSPTMRHVSRTHRAALDWLFDRIKLEPKIQIKYNDTKNQLADILTKGNFTRDEWNHLLCLFNISHFSSTNCSEMMSKRTQKDSGEERVTAKSKPMMNLVSRCSAMDPNVRGHRGGVR